MAARTRPLIALAAVACALTACGGSAPTTHEPTGNFTVTLGDYEMRPQNIRVPHTELTVTVVNKGRLGHTFRIRAGTRNVLKITTVRPGASRTRTFKLGPGHYQMYDALSNYAVLGAYGTLTVSG